MKTFVLDNVNFQNPELIISEFRQAGFKDTTYKGQDDVFLSKDFQAKQIPHIEQTLGFVSEEEYVRVELLKNGDLQICVLDSITFERYESTNENWILLAESVGVSI